MSIDSHRQNDIADFMEENGIIGVLDIEGYEFRGSSTVVTGVGSGLSTDSQDRLTSQGNVSAPVELDDGEKIIYGDSQDVSVRYDGGQDELRWAEEGSGDRMSLDKSNGDLSIDGSLSEGVTF